MGELLLIWVPRRPRLTSDQFRAMVDMAVGAGLVSFGSILIPGLLDKSSAFTVAYGLVGVIVFWSMALWFARRIR